jgi:hypothetical protein
LLNSHPLSTHKSEDSSGSITTRHKFCLVIVTSKMDLLNFILQSGSADFFFVRSKTCMIQIPGNTESINWFCCFCLKQVDHTIFKSIYLKCQNTTTSWHFKIPISQQSKEAWKHGCNDAAALLWRNIWMYALCSFIQDFHFSHDLIAWYCYICHFPHYALSLNYLCRHFSLLLCVHVCVCVRARARLSTLNKVTPCTL